MPIYEYACEKCHANEEIIQKFGEATPEVCPKCRAKGTLKRVVTSSAFHLKGGGWYKDLYSSTKQPDAAKSGGEKVSPKDEKAIKTDKIDKPSKKDD